MKVRLLACIGISLSVQPVLADRFTAARYEPSGDQLIVTLAYRGTHPQHEFTLGWGACKTERGEPTVAAEVLDSQSRDPARQNFTRTVHFSLRDMPCRPARVVLRTAPRYFVEVSVPAAP